MRGLSLADRLYARFANRKPFFYEGWGNLFALEYLLNVTDPAALYTQGPSAVQLEEDGGTWAGEMLVRRVRFESPYRFSRTFAGRTMVSWLPPEAAVASGLFVLPNKFAGGPVAVHFAATGDEGLKRRLHWMGLPLAREGVASLILEHPMYGGRRLWKRDARPARVTDFLMMSRAAQDEGIGVALELVRRGYGPIVFTGISMGGYMALAAAARSGLRAAVAACIPSHSAGPVYTEGVLSRSVDWRKLGAGLGDWSASVTRDRVAASRASRTRAGRTRVTREEVWTPEEKARAVLRRLLALGDIQNLPRVREPRAISVVNARRDAYIPPASRQAIHDCYPEAHYTELDRGHIGSFLFGADVFRRAIHEALARLR